jgi:uncharacterized repeat protein (TIGR03803 family)
MLAAAPVFEPVHAFEKGISSPGRTSLLRNSDGSFFGVSESGGAFDFGALYQLHTDGTIRILASFGGSAAQPGGSGRKGNLLRDDAGILWGATSSGGAGDEGTLFKFDPVTKTTATVVEFGVTGLPNPGAAPEGGITAGSDGHLWGTCSRGGLSGNGGVFKYHPGTGTLTFVASFTGTGGSLPGRWPVGELTADANGCLWGVTAMGGASDAGTILKVEPSTGTVTSVFTFTGESGVARGRLPQAALLRVAGFLWGTTQEGGLLNHGTVFRLDPTGPDFTTIVEFGSHVPTGPTDPASPLCLSGDGRLWGTTLYGGTANTGTIFNVAPASGLLTVAAEFGDAGLPGGNPAAGLVSDGSGALWGTSNPLTSAPLVFKIAEDPTAWQIITRFGEGLGYGAFAGLEADQAGQLWGLCALGGAAGAGTLYKLDPATEILTTVLDCGTGTVGARAPHFGLTRSGGKLYGQSAGGSADFGTVFSYDPAAGIYSTLGDLSGDSGTLAGRSPVDTLFQRPDGTLTGVTMGDGRAITTNYGGLVSVYPSTGVLDSGLSFTNFNGLRTPAAGVTVAQDGKLWGTFTGNASSTGGIYAATASGLNTVLQFTGFSGNFPGRYPVARLVPEGASILLGSTRSGGSAGSGTLFKYQIPSGPFTTLVHFTGNTGVSPGSSPQAELTPDGRGWFWGTTNSGGAGNHGTIFKVSSAGGFQSVFAFTQNSGPVPGRWPQSRLLLHTDGNLYGTASEGGVVHGRPAGGGQIFRLRFGPTPRTRSATGTGTTTARLQGTVNPNGTATSACFEWGYTAAGLTNNTAPVTVGADVAPIPHSAVLTGLTPGSLIYYRLRSENADQWQPQRGAVLSAQLPLTDPIESWRNLFSPNAANPSIAGDAADPDGDGLPNLAEYACGTHPLLADAVPLTVTPLADGRCAIQWSISQAAVDTTVTLLTSTDLASWQDTPHASEAPPAQGLRRFSVILLSPLPNVRQYARLQVTRP